MQVPLESPAFQPNAPASHLHASEVNLPHLLEEESEQDHPPLNWNDSIATLLRIGTSRAHVQAEHSEGAKAMLKGELEVEEYIRWLAILWRVYSALELGLAEHSSNPVLSPTYDPKVLARAPALAEDISHLLSLLPPSSTVPLTTQPSIPLDEEESPLPPFALPPFLSPIFIDPPQPVMTYINHLTNLASSPISANLLLSHAYVRYLGDLSGGQFIAARIKKSYGLSGVEGTAFYEFDVGGTGVADAEESRGERKKRLGEIKEWYRKGMDQGVSDDEELKKALVKEANLAFSLNTHLFSLIRPSASSSSPSTEVAITTSTTTSTSSHTTVTKRDPIGSSHLVTRPEYQGLRYYEIATLEKARLLRENPPKPNTWAQRFERFFIFAATALAGWVLSQYVGPFVMPYISEGMEGGLAILQAAKRGRGGIGITPDVIRAGLGKGARRGGYVGDQPGFGRGPEL